MSFNLKESLHDFRQMSADASPARRAFYLADGVLCWVLYNTDLHSYFLYRFYEKRPCLRRTYLSALDGNRLYRRLNMNSDQARILDNKVRFNRTFAAYTGREWLYVPEASEQELAAFLSRHETVIVKPIDSNQGRGVHKLRPGDYAGREAELAAELKDCLVEEVIVQHPVLAALNPASVNTVRVMTVRGPEGIVIMGAALRMGTRADSCVDNLHADGGIAAPIDPQSGIIHTQAMNTAGQRFLRHPTSGVVLPGLQIPHWEAARRMVLEAADVLDELGLAGWDVVITPDGCLLIEGNSEPGWAMMQMFSDRGGLKRRVRSVLEQGR